MSTNEAADRLYAAIHDEACDEVAEGVLKELARAALAHERSAGAAPLDVCPDCGLSAQRIGEIHITAQVARAEYARLAAVTDRSFGQPVGRSAGAAPINPRKAIHRALDYHKSSGCASEREFGSPGCDCYATLQRSLASEGTDR